MPDVGDGARKQRPSLRPVDPIIVCDLAALASPRIETGLLAPLRFEINSIRGIGHHDEREGLAAQQARRVSAGGCVAAHYSMLGAPFAWAQQPKVARPGYRSGGNVRNFVLVGEARGLLVSLLARQFLVVETKEIQVEVLVLQSCQLFAEQRLVPASIKRELVIGDRECATLAVRQMVQHNPRNFTHPLRPGRPEAPFASNNSAVRPDQNWTYETEFPDGGGDLCHLLARVRARVYIARD